MFDFDPYVCCMLLRVLLRVLLLLLRVLRLLLLLLLLRVLSLWFIRSFTIMFVVSGT